MKAHFWKFLEHVLGVILAWFWKHFKKTLEERMSTGFNIGGLGNIPAEVFTEVSKIVPHVIGGLEAGTPAEEIVNTVRNAVPSMAVSIAESVINSLFPGVGSLVNFVKFLAMNQRQMTQEEVNAFMDRFGAGTQS